MKYIKTYEGAKVKWYKKGEFSEPEETEDIKDSDKFELYNKDFTDFLIDNDAYDDFLEELCKQNYINIK